MPLISNRASGASIRRPGSVALRQLIPGINDLRQMGRAGNRPPTHVTHVFNTAADIEITVLRGNRSVIDAIATEWEDLCTEGPSNAPFFTPTWIRAWLDSFAPSATVVLVTARRDGRLRGVLPLIEQRIGYRGMLVTRLSAPSNYHSGRADLVHGSGDAADVVAAIWDALGSDMRWDILEYRDVIEESAFSQVAAAAANAGCAVIKRETLCSPYIPFDAETSFEKYGPAKDMRRARRLLDKLGGYTTRRTAPADLASLERLVAQEHSGWKGKAGSSIASEPNALAFYRALVSAKSRSFTAVVNEIMVEGEPIAINLGIEMGSRYYDPKRTYSESHHRYGPGHLITHEILIDLPNRGIFEFDWMGHDDSYKLVWSDNARQHYHYLIFRRNLKGNILHKGVVRLVPLVKYWRTSLQQHGSRVGRNQGKRHTENISTS